jgi:hypothetical protein
MLSMGDRWHTVLSVTNMGRTAKPSATAVRIDIYEKRRWMFSKHRVTLRIPRIPLNGTVQLHKQDFAALGATFVGRAVVTSEGLYGRPAQRILVSAYLHRDIGGKKHNCQVVTTFNEHLSRHEMHSLSEYVRSHTDVKNVEDGSR